MTLTDMANKSVDQWESAVRDTTREMCPDAFSRKQYAATLCWCHDMAVQLHDALNDYLTDTAPDWTALVEKVTGNVTKMGRAQLRAMAKR